jgi:hypothetical protein
MPYGFVRSTDRWGVNSIPFQQLQAAGLGNLLFNSQDPHLAEALAAADKAGVQSGIWLPAGNEGDPEAYAQQLYGLYQKYGANRTYVPNIEFTGKGYKGSPGWDWNEKMMAKLQALGVPPNIAVAMLPNQDDFNYGAYTSRGAKIMPEAFGANTGTDLFDPEQIRQTLLRNGVSADMIDTILAPGQNGVGSMFTVDDLSPEQLRALTLAHQAQGTTTTTAAPQTSDPNAPIDAADPSADAAPTHRPDSQNPAAVSYARHRLALLARQGIHPKDFGVTGDPTAQWRALSAIVGAKQAINSDQDYAVRGTTPQSVQDYVRKLIAKGPQSAPAHDHPGAGYSRVQPSHPSDGYSRVQPHSDGYSQVHSASERLHAAMNSLSHSRPGPGVLPDVMRRVGPMQKAIQVAAAMRHVRQLRPTRHPGRGEQ